MEKVFTYIDRNQKEYLEDLFKLLRQPSISSQNIGVTECATMLANMIEDIGMDAEIIHTPGQPIVYAERIVSPDALTVLIYGHYDVQPPEPLSEWHSEPFEPTIRDGKIFARGVGDNKGQLMAQVLAVKSYLQCYGELPINVKFVFEGEEESTSVHLEQFVHDHQEKLKADLVYTSDGPMHASGAPFVILGVRGIQYVELNACGAKWDNHSGNKGGVVPNPAWKLVDLLQTMRDGDGKVLIEGFYDDIVSPTEKERKLIKSLPFNQEETNETNGYEGDDDDAESYYRKLAFEPTFNICGFVSGYGGEGSKTIIPSKATLKMDMRLVVNQDPKDIFTKFKNHVKKHAPEVEVKDLGFMYPSRTSVDHDFVDVITKSVRSTYKQEPIVLPSLGGSLPDYVWTKILGLPSIVVPYANADENNHSPNENMEVELFYKGIKNTCQVIYDLGEYSKRSR
ncbi:M20/M25/M40 family metallo-hydrolase [Bacillus shivajii]|uniref:M20/M25/M40 family metallo-hydrolase n=1 Tax=Bacillus shivajii TaxID=1983719 RepID=UPI001CFC2700|nr:M20/M25/M40 family metallo-hydrolase [Bacillus shivajii]UCZ51397.1 M20/M25/M40 family metallo-hydrolase [Bacillus shivajii]